MNIWTLTVTLTLNTTLQFLHQAIQNIMVYQPITSGCKKSRLVQYIWEKQTYSVMSPHCDLELEDDVPMFSHDSFAHDDTSSYQVWLQKVQQLRRYGLDENSMTFLTFAVTLSTKQWSNLFTRQLSLRWCVIKPKFSCKRVSSSEDKAESHILTFWAFTVTLTLKTAMQFFHMTLWLMMTYHHTKFGDKWFRDSKDLNWTNFQWHFEVLLWPWPWT